MSQTKLYVGNLSYDVTNDDLQTLFGEKGPLAEAKVIVDHGTGRSKGFGFVTFENAEDAKSAEEAFNGQEHFGRTLKVNEARERDNSRRPSSRPPRREGMRRF